MIFRDHFFFKNGLGWTSKVHNDFAFFQLNGIVFALYPRIKLAEDATVPAKGSGLRYHVATVEEIERSDEFRLLKNWG